ncbi:hydroxyethylthiazole kinase [Lactobacillus sp. CBA3606]|uniref:hydroxyethylthiazole kinase n=1 Tax=Lactobacillus sp. CBA3606 TaxID=2099789 RepID=UPI000CFE255A|nr:hydroxyethylthiazole kinase [Lactobacillus sp. CBA3606]AVK64150.1 hydroxyethylthiazole kinase [Lactobacillus sp. CBA3606]
MDLTLLAKLRQQNPVVLNLANWVTAQAVANGLNAVGASPIMSAEVQEAAAVVKIAGAVCFNLGTVTTSQVEQMQVVGRFANAQQKPIVLDPVAVGAVPYRRQVALGLLTTCQVAVIRGNAGEIAALADFDWQANGIDAGTGTGDLVKIAQACAQKYHCVVLLSGPTDIITDGHRVIQLTNGTSLFQLQVGAGDLLSSLVAAMLAVSPTAVFEATQVASAVLATTGEWVANQLVSERPGSFGTALIDKLHLVTAAEIQAILTIKGADN